MSEKIKKNTDKELGKFKMISSTKLDFKSIEISLETKELWKEACEIGIHFEIQEQKKIGLKTNFNNMQISNAVYADVQKTKHCYECRIEKYENELIKLVFLRERLEELLGILKSSEIDETNADLINECIKTIQEKHQD